MMGIFILCCIFEYHPYVDGHQVNITCPDRTLEVQFQVLTIQLHVIF